MKGSVVKALAKRPKLHDPTPGPRGPVGIEEDGSYRTRDGRSYDPETKRYRKPGVVGSIPAKRKHA